jgi:hypothetical protein
MITGYLRISGVAVLVGLVYVPPGPPSRTPLVGNPQAVDRVDQRALQDFQHRVRAYAELHRDVARTVPPLIVTTDTERIWQSVEALASALVRARPNARAGDIFTPEIATAFRYAINAGCKGDGVGLLLRTHDEEELGEFPLPAPAVHARWPDDLPLTTMPPDILAVLPPLPAELEYRFWNRDLVLWDADANLIVDFVTDAIVVPSTEP